MYLKQVRPFPSFHDIRNDLLLEELTLDVEASSGSTTALAASGGQQQRPLPAPAQLCQAPSFLAPFSDPRSITPPDIGGSGGGGERHCCNHSNDDTTPTTDEGMGDTP
jgi:hypothetical protein